MSSPDGGLAEEVSRESRAMASTVTVRALAGGDRAAVERAVVRALAVFDEVEASCTRFVPTSPLMRANAEPDRWHEVPFRCYCALEEAHRAYLLTKGRFDPRILADLSRMGYDRSLAFGTGAVATGAASPCPRQPLPPWKPRFEPARQAVLLGGHGVDLGGIGKGLAVRWASQRLRGAAADHLVEAGGDCYCAGRSPEGGAWRVGVEDPFGGSSPVAVLELTDRACATSSIRLRHWEAAGRPVHHLVDPRTGLPGGAGLRAVTVVGDDPAVAEVWSKTLFLEGLQAVGGFADRRGLAALWISDDGALGVSAAMSGYLSWRVA
ncbi:MAG: FAD:protein FMN transferase [Candidatus Dormibacteria bacterium]